MTPEYQGWRAWFDDGSVYDSEETPEWSQVPEDAVLVRIIYYTDGTRQIQQGLGYYYEAPHHSGESIFGAGSNRREIRRRYPGAVLKRGRWAPDDYYRAAVACALSSPWKPSG